MKAAVVKLKTEKKEKTINSFVGLNEKNKDGGLLFYYSLICHNYEHGTKSLDVSSNCICNYSIIHPLLKAICRDNLNNNERGRLPK